MALKEARSDLNSPTSCKTRMPDSQNTHAIRFCVCERLTASRRWRQTAMTHIQKSDALVVKLRVNVFENWLERIRRHSDRRLSRDFLRIKASAKIGQLHGTLHNLWSRSWLAFGRASGVRASFWCCY